MAQVVVNVAARPLSIFNHWAFWIFLLIGAGIAGFQCLMNPIIGTDTIRYLVPMQNLLSGKGYTINGNMECFFSPGYGLLAALPYLLIRDLEYAGMLVSALSYLFIVGCSFYIGMRYFNETTGIIAGFFTAMFPMLVSSSYVPLADVPYTAFLISSIALSLKIQTDCSKKLLLSSILGGIMGFGCLIRPDLLLVALSVVGLLFIQGAVESYRQGQLSVKPFISGIMLAVAFFLVVLPYMIFLYQHTGNFTVSNKLGLAAMGGSDVITDWNLNNAPNPIVYLYNHISDTYNIIKRNAHILCFGFLISMSFMTIPLGIVWIIYPFFADRKVRDFIPAGEKFLPMALTFAVFILPLVPALLYSTGDRYVMPYFVLMIPLLSYLIVAFLTGVLGVLNKKKLSLFLLSVVFLWAAWSAMPVPRLFDGFQWNIVKVLQNRHGHFVHRAAGLWFRDKGTAPEQLSIIAPSKAGVILFYASGKSEPKGRSYSFSGLKSFEDVLKKMKDEHIEYLFIDKYYGANNEISQAIWRDKVISDKYGLKLVHSVEGLYLIYRYM